MLTLLWYTINTQIIHIESKALLWPFVSKAVIKFWVCLRNW